MTLSAAYLQERLRYDPATGKLYWRAHPEMPNNWNGRFAGREAFLTVHSKGYRQGVINYQRHLAHRVAWALHHGAWPEGEIDHEDHNRANNRIGNLRVTTSTGNKKNQSRRKDNTSGMTGVHWDAACSKWSAQIMVGRQTRFLGRFDQFEDAVAARQIAEREYDFHPNHGKKQT